MAETPPDWEQYLAWASEASKPFAQVPCELRAQRDFVAEWLKRRQASSWDSNKGRKDDVLFHVPDALRADRDLVLKAVALHGEGVRLAHSDLRRDRKVILTAVGKMWRRGYVKAFELAPVDLFSDAELLHEVRRFRGLVRVSSWGPASGSRLAVRDLEVQEGFGFGFYIFRVALLSGKSCTVIADGVDTGRSIRDRACDLLQLDRAQKMQLLLQDEVVHDGGGWGTPPRTWPGVCQQQINHLLMLFCEGRELDGEPAHPPGLRAPWGDM